MRDLPHKVMIKHSIRPGKFQEMTRWMKEHCKGKFDSNHYGVSAENLDKAIMEWNEILRYGAPKKPAMYQDYSFVFSNPDDALLFKLTFAGMV